MANNTPFLEEIESSFSMGELQSFKCKFTEPITYSWPPNSPTSDYLVHDDQVVGQETSCHKFESLPDPKKDVKQKLRQQQAAIRKKRYQRRLKHERETLRRLEIELSRQLARLQIDVKMKKRQAASKQQQQEQQAPVRSIWREIAHLQRAKCLHAQHQQKELINAISVQASYLAVMRGLIPAMDTQSAVASSRHMNTQANRVVFDHHISIVNAGYAQVDKILREFDLIATQDGITSLMRRADTGTNVEFFQHFNRFTQPFSFKHTHQTMWKLATLQHRQYDRQDFNQLANPEDTVVLRFRFTRTLNTGETMSVKQRYVCRRFVGETRTIFTWKTYSEDEDSSTRMLLEETGWVCLQPSSDESMTVVRVCVCQTPMQQGPFSPETQRFYHLMQSSVLEDAQAITTALSRLLLEETLSCIEM